MELPEQILDLMAEEVIPMSEQIFEKVADEIIPFIVEGVCAGFIVGTLFALAAYGVFKAISLLGIKNISS